MPVERSNPPGLSHPTGYNHVVKDGSTIYVAGQVARDKDGNTVGVGDGAAQAEQVFRNLQTALGSVGSDLRHLMKLNVFLTHREDMAAYRAVRSKFIPDSALPVSTLILCSGLADPDFRIEIEVIASMP
ncbi:MAG: RidA family protein [Chloroflexi bacterium]|nr:RidA family protein [Chloroflexota bacterium]MCH8225841.1 RidA family protein [Chloroflexota bacterium]